MEIEDIRQWVVDHPLMRERIIAGTGLTYSWLWQFSHGRIKSENARKVNELGSFIEKLRELGDG